jgi:translation initiation factor 3 subunit M
LDSALKSDQITRKLRLLALTSLAASSSTKEITYADIAKALKLDEDDIEISVIDGQCSLQIVHVPDLTQSQTICSAWSAIHSGLLKASLSQPTKTLRVQSVQTRSFGSAEWQLLDKRLGEWKTVLEDVQKTIQDAIVVNEQSGKDQGRGGYKKGARKPNAKSDENKGEESSERAQNAVVA